MSSSRVELLGEMKSLKKSLSQANEEWDLLSIDLGTAFNEIDDLEQYTRKHNLEIHGIPEQTDENLAEQVIALGKAWKALNVTTRGEDIDICHRLVTGRNGSKPRPIIVRFKSYLAKKELYGARKSLVQRRSYMELAKVSRIKTWTKFFKALASCTLTKLWKKCHANSLQKSGGIPSARQFSSNFDFSVKVLIQKKSLM